MKKRLVKALSILLTLIMLFQCIPLTLSIGAVSASVAIPTFTAGTSKGTVDLYNDVVGLYYSGVTLSEFNAYITTLTNAGFTKQQSNTIGNNSYATMVSSAGMVHVAYRAFDGWMYIITDPLTSTSVKTADSSWTKITDTTLAIFSLNHSHRELTDANGMCFIITLEDGSYIILDGGYEEDAERLYNFLYDNNKRSDGKIVIAAWFISHPDGDHYGAFSEFSLTHAKDVVLQSVVANPVTASAISASSENWFITSLSTCMARFGGNVKLYLPHTGQKLGFCGVDFEVIYTHEDMYFYNTAALKSGSGSHNNNSSTVVRMSFGGQTFLFTGDTMVAANNMITSMHGGALKSDFLQIPHHGNSGLTQGLVDQAKPTYLIWTTSQASMELRTNGVWYPWVASSDVSVNQYAANYVGGLSNCFALDGDVEIMTLPYVPGQSKIEYYVPDDTVRQQNTVSSFSENFSDYSAGTYTAEQFSELLGWDVSGTAVGSVFTITNDGKLKISVPYYSNEATSTVNGDLLLDLATVSAFAKGRTVLEFDMTYNETYTAKVNGSRFRVGLNGNNYYEFRSMVQGFYKNNACVNGSTVELVQQTRPENVLYNKYTTNYNKAYADSADSRTIFGSTDHYKVVIDPHNGIDIYVNGSVISSSDRENGWVSTYSQLAKGGRLMLCTNAGVEVVYDNIQVYAEEKDPELLITEIAPAGTLVNSGFEFIEVYNNSDTALNIYDYCIVRDSDLTNYSSNAVIAADNVAKIIPGSTTYQPSGNSSYPVTHTNPSYEEGWLQPGEVALLWIATNTAFASETAGNGNTLADFRSGLGLTNDQKAFVCYNNYNFSMNNSGNYYYGIGYADYDYTSTKQHTDHCVGNLVSYVYHNTSEVTLYGGEKAPICTFSGYGSIRYYYPNNNSTRHGVKLAAESNVHTAGTIEAAQKKLYSVVINGAEQLVAPNTVIDLREYMTDDTADFSAEIGIGNTVKTVTDPSLTVTSDMEITIYEDGEKIVKYFYYENFNGYAAGSYDINALNRLLGWRNIHADAYYTSYPNNTLTSTVYSDIAKITADGKLNLYNRYNNEYRTGEYIPNSELIATIGFFEGLDQGVTVLEYDFLYTDKGDSAGTSHASFLIGKSADGTGNCLQPTFTAQGFHQMLTSKTLHVGELYPQVRPEWIPYSKKTTGYDYPYGGVSGHYNIFGGTNHVKIVIDPVNGMEVYINDIMISTPLDGEAWRNGNYADTIGELFALHLTNGIDVTLDNIKLYQYEDRKAPELLITELGTSTGAAEFIELYNNSERALNIFDYCIVRNTDLTKIGANWQDATKITKDNIATILPGVHTYTAEHGGQSVELINPTDGTINPGETVVLWIATNTTFDVDQPGTPTGLASIDAFREYHGLDSSVKVFACYNNNNFSLWNGGDLAYAVGYASENYLGRNSSCLEEMVCYVYANTSTETIYGTNIGTTAYAQVGATVEYYYPMDNSVRHGLLLEANADTNSIGYILEEQAQMLSVTINGQTVGVRFGTELDLSAYETGYLYATVNGAVTTAKTVEITKSNMVINTVGLSVDTLTGASIRIGEDEASSGLRWETAVNKADWDAISSDENVTIQEMGTLIIHQDDLGNQAFTLDLVGIGSDDARKIVAHDWLYTTNNEYVFAGSVSNILQKNYTLKFAAVGFVTVEINGETITLYGGYNSAEHDRTVADVAAAFMADTVNFNKLTDTQKDVIRAYVMATSTPEDGFVFDW